MTISIISKKNGFRRCGVEHPDTWTEYPDKRFTKEELEKLEAEPMLMVRRMSKKDLEKEITPVTIDDFKDQIDQQIKEALEADRVRITEAYKEAHKKNASDDFIKEIMAG